MTSVRLPKRSPLSCGAMKLSMPQAMISGCEMIAVM